MQFEDTEITTGRRGRNRARSLFRAAVTRSGWLIVTGACLTLSAWSLYFVARHYGVPAPIAVIVSACFDGAAILSADLALRYARSSDSGTGPRLGVLAFAGLSGWLNSQHAVMVHDPSPARVLYAAPPVIAVIIFEFHTRFERRAALRNAGRVPAALPALGRWAWVLFPLRSLGTIRAIVAYRLSVIRARNMPGGPVTVPAVPASPRVIRQWARSAGISVPARGKLPAEIIAAYKSGTDVFSMNGHVS